MPLADQTLIADHVVVQADVAEAVFPGLGSRRGEEQADAWAESTIGAIRTIRHDLARWQTVLAGPGDAAGAAVLR